MDLFCSTCGEPWELDYVLHEEPEAFSRKGAWIRHCPACAENFAENGPPTGKHKEWLDLIKEVSLMCGDDVDGACCQLEDARMMWMSIDEE